MRVILVSCIASHLLLRMHVCYAQVRFDNDTVYKFTETILSSLSEDSTYDAMRAAQDFSFIGDYENALMYGDVNRSPYMRLTKADSLYFAKFDPVPAKEYIVKEAKHKQIVIINEAHHLPYHRIFTSSLLKDLYKLGFRYFGAETLSNLDGSLNKRGYPSISTGYYTVEPQYGNLIRKALSIGYKVFPYEATSNEAISTPEAREIEQAKNIDSILVQNPKAKILIHAGYDHIREDSLGGDWIMAMAGRLREFSGIDPFTINQEVLNERSNSDLENPFYDLIEIKYPTIFINEHGEAFAGPEGANYYDIRMAHPRTRNVKHRPHWLKSDDKEYVYLTEKQLSVGFPCLIKVYNAGENKEAVPVDVVEILDKENIKPLILSSGSYHVVIINRNGKYKRIKLQV